MSSPLKFNTKAQQQEVEIDGDMYVLKEASAQAATEFQNKALENFDMEIDEEGKTRTKISGSGSLADQAPFLLSKCLYKRNEEGTLTRVELALIKSWPNRIIKPLYELARDMSDLGEEESLEGLRKEQKKLAEKIAKLEAKEEERKNS